MRVIKYTRKFKSDYKREKKSNHYSNLDHHLITTVELLAADANVNAQDARQVTPLHCAALYGNVDVVVFQN